MTDHAPTAARRAAGIRPTPVESAVTSLLDRVPDRWEPLDLDHLSAPEAEAVGLLTSAGLVEREARLRVHMAGHPAAVAYTQTYTGEEVSQADADAVGSVSWPLWREAFEEWAVTREGCPFRCEVVGCGRWRITTEGVKARGEARDGRTLYLFDFLFRRGFFSSRRMVTGYLRVRDVERPAYGEGPEHALPRVDVANWPEGAKQIAATVKSEMMAELLAAMCKLPPTDVPDGSPPPEPAGEFQTVEGLASALGVSHQSSAVRSCLQRHAAKYPGCRSAVKDSRKGESQYVYRTAEVWPVLVKNLPGWSVASGDR